MLAPLALAATACLPPHPAPPVWIQADVRESEVVVAVSGERVPLYGWLGLDSAIDRPLGADERARAVAAARALLADPEGPNRVAIEGSPAADATVELAAPEDADDGRDFATLTARYPCEGRPRRVDFVWRTFAGTEYEGRTEVPLVVRSEGRVPELWTFTPEEPGFVWHAKGARERRTAARVTGEPSAGHLLVPLVAVAVGAAALALLLLLRRGRAPAEAFVGTVVVAGLACWGTRGLAVVAVPLPWGEEVRMPSGDQARILFQTLHENLYAAFEARTEEEIYDLLAVSVEPALLDEIYVEIYESLVMRGEGGAVCDVESIEVEGWEVALDPDPTAESLAFEVEWDWTVRGIVTHWGHAHRRRNEYVARYTVRHDGESWKIAAVDVLDSYRIDEDDA